MPILMARIVSEYGEQEIEVVSFDNLDALARFAAEKNLSPWDIEAFEGRVVDSDEWMAQYTCVRKGIVEAQYVRQLELRDERERADYVRLKKKFEGEQP